MKTLVRPTLRTTLNNLGCALLVNNLLFGSSTFLFHCLYYLHALDVDILCSAIVIFPQLYRWLNNYHYHQIFWYLYFHRIFSFYILIGNLFLRGLLVKHAKYISLESHVNTLMVSDFGLPVWVTISTFSFLNLLYLGLNEDFPFNFPSVRTCRGISTFIDTGHQHDNYKMLLSVIVCLFLLTGFVIMSHSKIYALQKSFRKTQSTRKQLRQNVNTVQQILAAAYLKVLCSIIILR